MSRPLPKGTVLGAPFCAACGHDLTGAVASAACPECGRPLVEVLERRTPRRFGAKPTRRYRSETRVLGMPLLAIATGPDEKGAFGHARGFFAIGDVATGVFAFGGVARGVVAFGGLSLGFCSFGGCSLSLLASFGGLSVALLGSAVGGCSVGLLANGGLAIGGLAQGGAAIGWLSRGQKALGPNAWPFGSTVDEATRALFDRVSWLIGPAGGGPQIHYGVAWTAAIAISVAFLMLALLVLSRRGEDAVEAELRGERRERH
jgi:hypothetical protein